MRFKKGRSSPMVLDGIQFSSGLFVSTCSKLGQGLGGGNKGTAVLAVGPSAMVKLVDVAKAVHFVSPCWVKSSCMKHDPRPTFKSVTLMVEGAAVHGRKN
jgi:hypothetical protein